MAPETEATMAEARKARPGQIHPRNSPEGAIPYSVILTTTSGRLVIAVRPLPWFHCAH
jgi:hypothetical protein